MTDSFVTARREGSVLVVDVDDGRANAFSESLLADLTAEIERAEADDNIGAVVIAGREGTYFAGFDLNVIRAGDARAITAMTTAGGDFIRKCYGASVPVVAACTGHAVAAGALLLCGCDHRVGPDAPVKIGLNEVAIALILPGWALTIAQERLSKRHVQRCIANAELVDGRGAVDAGFLDEVVDSDEVVARAVEVAQGLADTLDPGAYAGTVTALRGDALAAMDADVAATRERAGL